MKEETKKEKTKEVKEKNIKKTILEIIPYIIVLILVILVKTYLIAPIQVNGESMMSTLHDRDIMILNKVNYKFNKIKRFDIVVVKYNDTYLIKRVIGLPGENIEYKDNKLYIDGKHIKEKNLPKDTITNDFSLKEITGKVKIPKNSYFVMGDNRSNSTDSRVLGPFNKKDIEGNTSLTIFPFNRLGNKK